MASNNCRDLSRNKERRMPRPSWSGTIQISLVNFAVDVYPAVSSTRPISFHEVDRKTLNRIHHKNVSSGPAAEENADAEEKSAKHGGMHIAAKSASAGTNDE